MKAVTLAVLILLVYGPTPNESCHASLFKVASSAIVKHSAVVGKSKASAVSGKAMSKIAAYGVGGTMMGAGDVVGDVVKAKIDGQNNLNIIRALQSAPSYQPTVKIEELTEKSLVVATPPPVSQSILPYSPFSVSTLNDLVESYKRVQNKMTHEPQRTVNDADLSTTIYATIASVVAGAGTFFLLIFVSVFMCIRRSHKGHTDSGDYSVKFVHESV